jgi:hypothetical protein
MIPIVYSARHYGGEVFHAPGLVWKIAGEFTADRGWIQMGGYATCTLQTSEGFVPIVPTWTGGALE